MGKIYTFTGASGSGKSTMVRGLLDRLEDAEIILSVTTRERRNDEILGEYLHISHEEFNLLEDAEKFLWAISAHGNQYGTLKSSVDRAVSTERNSFMILIPGVLNFLYEYTDKVASFFILSPSDSVLRKRLRERGESLEEVEGRIRDCKEWESKARNSDHPYIFIRNDGTVDETLDSVMDYIE